MLLCSCATSPIANNLQPSLFALGKLSLSSTEFEQRCIKQQQNLTQRIERLTKDNAIKKPFDALSYLKKIDHLAIDLENSMNDAQLLNNTHPEETFRTIASECEQQLHALQSILDLSQRVFKQLQVLDRSKLDALSQYHVEKLTKQYKHNGVHLTNQQRDALLQLKNEINDLGQQFGKNIREDRRFITIGHISGLLGLPEDYIASLPKNDKGEWLVSTDYPSAYPFFRYADSDTDRKVLYQQFKNRGYPQNENVLKAIIEKRHQLARLLSHPYFADYATENAMIGSEKNARDFINRISQLTDKQAQQDYQHLLDALLDIDSSATYVGEWQKAYLAEKVRQQKYQVDAREVRQYFSYSNVQMGLFNLMQQLFDVDIQPWETDAWHPSVNAFEMRGKDGAILGRFYLDMHPREGKYKHAAHFGLRTGISNQQLPVSALVCNFPNDSMEHNQVETFIHEFGHLVHSLIGGHQPWLNLSGIATEPDFVETPSQLLEEWVWDPDVLSAFARNAQGKSIPRELVIRMRKAREFGRASDIRTQMFYAALSLDYYSTDPASMNLTNILIRDQKKYSMFKYIPDTHFYANFGHLYGYSARYYTYMWSKVIAADLYSEFNNDRLDDQTSHQTNHQKIAEKYRDKILIQAGSKPAADLIQDFLGRPFSFEPFIQQLEGKQ